MNQLRYGPDRSHPAWLPVLGLVIVLALLGACAPAGPVVTPAPAPTEKPTVLPSPQVALTWQRDGGIAGFCDRLIIVDDGQFAATTCRGAEIQGRLSAAQLARLDAWLSKFKPLEFETSDPAVADAMTIRLTFAGRGTAGATQAEQAELERFAADAFPAISFEVPTSPLPTPTPEVFNPVPPEARAADAARDALAESIGLPIEQIELLQVTPAEWPNGCLGLEQPGEMCLMVITPGFQVMLQVDRREYEFRTNQDATVVRYAGSPDPLAPCTGEGLATYTSRDADYCFAYPAPFEMDENLAGMQPGVYVSGPALDDSPEPIQAMLFVESYPAPAGQDLAAVVEGYLEQFAGLDVPSIAEQVVTLGSELAIQLETVPGRTGSRDILALHDGAIYHLMFMPAVDAFPQAAADVRELYEAVVGSWAYLP